MGHHRAGLLLILLASSALADQGPPVYMAIGTKPVVGGACTGPRVQINYDDGATWCCVASAWATCGASAGGAPTSAHYVTTQAEAGLSAEAVLPTCSGTDKLTFNGTTISCAADQTGTGSPGGSSGNLQTNNGAGGFGAYAGATCTGGQYATAASSSGALTCSTPPGTYSLPDATGAVTGGVRLTGDLGGTAASPTVPGLAGKAATVACGASTWASTLGAGASSCTQPGWTDIASKPSSFAPTTAGTGSELQVRSTGSALAAYAGSSCSAGQAPLGLTAAGAVTGCFTPAGTYSLPAATASVLGGVKGTGTGTTCSAGQYSTGHDAAGALQCGTPAGTYSLPDATSLVTGGVRLTGQLGGTATSPTVTGVTGAIVGVSNINATGTPNSSTFLRGDGSWQAASGSGAPTTAQYWVGAADAALSAEKDLSGFTGLVLNTAGTPSAYAGASCTNQFPRSVNASGAWTCASITAADLPVVTVADGGTGLSTIAADQTFVATATDTVAAKSLPSCSNATTSKLLYDTTTHAFSCGTDQTAAGSGTLLRVTASDYTNSTTTPSTILSTSVANATEYGFMCVIVAQGTATSLPRFNINGPSASNVSFVTERFTTTSAQTLLILQAFSAAAQTAACTTSCAATNLVTKIFGSFTTTAAGTFALQGTSSTAAQTVTVRRGSYCILY